MKTYSIKTQKAIDTYGIDNCIKAARLYAENRNGGAAIADEIIGEWDSNKGDAMINAGKEIMKAK